MASIAEQMVLFESGAPRRRRSPAFSDNKSAPIHRWVPWIAGFSASFVQTCIREFMPTSGARSRTVLDPFAGVGTTLVETLRFGYDAVGFEINPYASLATRVKLACPNLDPEKLLRESERFSRFVSRRLQSNIEPLSSQPEGFRSRVSFYSPRVLRQVLLSLDFINAISDRQVRDVFLLAFGSVMVSFSNYSYEPSLTTRQGVGREPVKDANVPAIIRDKLAQIIVDIRGFQEELRLQPKRPRGRLYSETFMKAEDFLAPSSVDLVITSPPYLNNYHYVRNTRPQLHWLGLNSPKLMEELERQNIGRFWQTVREAPPVALSVPHDGIAKQVDTIRNMNPDKRAYGGPGWANYVASYYNDTFRYLEILKRLLRRRAKAVIVVGNSIIQGNNLPVDKHISEIAAEIGLETRQIRLLREKRVGSSIVDSSCRNGNGTKATLYESAVILARH